MTFFTVSYSVRQRSQIEKVVSAVQQLADGVDVVENAFERLDLSQYGGATGVTLIWGDKKKGLEHIGYRRGNEVVLGVLEAAAIGDITKFVEGKKTVHLERNGYEAVLSLDENGEKKTWLLTGWKKGMPDAPSEVSTHPEATQNGPTFSRAELGAGIQMLQDKVEKSKSSYSVAPASYLSEVAAAMDAAQDGEAKRLIEEAALRAADRGRVRMDVLEREQIYEQRAETRALQLEEDLANLELRLVQQRLAVDGIAGPQTWVAKAIRNAASWHGDDARKTAWCGCAMGEWCRKLGLPIPLG